MRNILKNQFINCGKEWKIGLFFFACAATVNFLNARVWIVTDLNYYWKFYPGDEFTTPETFYNGSKKSIFQHPHDGGIEGDFSDKNTTTLTREHFPQEWDGSVKIYGFYRIRR